MPPPITIDVFLRHCAALTPFLTAETTGPSSYGIHSGLDPKRSKKGEATALARQILEALSVPDGEPVTDERPLRRVRVPFPHPFDDFPKKPVVFTTDAGSITDDTAVLVQRALADRWMTRKIPGRHPKEPHLSPAEWVQSLPSGLPSTTIYAMPDMLHRMTVLRASYPEKDEPFGVWTVTRPAVPTPYTPATQVREIFTLDRRRAQECHPESNQMLGRYAHVAYHQFCVGLQISRFYLEMASRWVNALNNNDPHDLAIFGPGAESWQLVTFTDQEDLPTLCCFRNTNPEINNYQFMTVGPYAARQVMQVAGLAAKEKLPLMMF